MRRREFEQLAFNSCIGGRLVYLFRLLRLYLIFLRCHGTDLSGVRVVFTADRGVPRRLREERGWMAFQRCHVGVSNKIK